MKLVSHTQRVHTLETYKLRTIYGIILAMDGCIYLIK